MRVEARPDELVTGLEDETGGFGVREEDGSRRVDDEDAVLEVREDIPDEDPEVLVGGSA